MALYRHEDLSIPRERWNTCLYVLVLVMTDALNVPQAVILWSMHTVGGRSL